MLQLKKFQDIPVSTREEARESRPHIEEPRFRLLAREEGSFPCVVGKEFPAFRSQLNRRGSPQERREELQGRATIPRDPRCLSPFQENLFSLHCLDCQAEDRLTPRWHVDSPVGKTRGKATDSLIHVTGSVTLLLQLGRKAHVHAPTRDVDLLHWGDSRSTQDPCQQGEESSGSCTDPPPTRQPTGPCCGVLSMKVLFQYLLGGNRRPLGNQEMIPWLPPSPDRIKEQ